MYRTILLELVVMFLIFAGLMLAVIIGIVLGLLGGLILLGSVVYFKRRLVMYTLMHRFFHIAKIRTIIKARVYLHHS